jgi:hypothetical protein
MKNIIHLVVAVVMSTMVYGQDIIERVPPAQTDYETVYGPFEDEICELCLADGNYNFYTYLTDSLKIWDSIIRPTAGFGLSVGTTSSIYENSGSYGFDFIFGIISGTEFNFSHEQFLSKTETEKEKYDWQNQYKTTYSEIITNTTISKNTIGIKIMPISFGSVKPYFQYSLSNNYWSMNQKTVSTTYDIYYQTYPIQSSSEETTSGSFTSQEYTIGAKIHLLEHDGMQVGINGFYRTTSDLIDFSAMSTNPGQENISSTITNSSIGIYIQF